MASLDDLYAQVPTSEIASKLGADEAEVDNAVHTLVPVLLSGLQQNAPAARGLLDAGGGLNQVDQSDGHQAIATLFGGNDTDQVASALAKGGAGNSDLLKQLLPVLLPIVLAYIGNQLSAGGSSAPQKKEPAPVQALVKFWAASSVAAPATSPWAASSATYWAERGADSAISSAACSAVRSSAASDLIRSVHRYFPGGLDRVEPWLLSKHQDQ
jgi:Bacterial protein of unknown function (DUF937)